MNTADNNPLDYLEDILKAIEKAEQFTADMSFEDFKKDEKTQFAVIRALEIVGEASNKIPAPIQSSYQNIPWREITGMRNKLIHDYMGVNEDVVWRTIQEDLPDLKNSIREMIKNFTKK